MDLRNKIWKLLEEYMIEWIKTHKESNILDYIEHNKQIKLELNRELNKFIDKTMVKEINKKLAKDKEHINRDKDKVQGKDNKDNNTNK